MDWDCFEYWCCVQPPITAVVRSEAQENSCLFSVTSEGHFQQEEVPPEPLFSTVISETLEGTRQGWGNKGNMESLRPERFRLGTPRPSQAELGASEGGGWEYELPGDPEHQLCLWMGNVGSQVGVQFNPE